MPQNRAAGTGFPPPGSCAEHSLPAAAGKREVHHSLKAGRVAGHLALLEQLGTGGHGGSRSTEQGGSTQAL